MKSDTYKDKVFEAHRGRIAEINEHLDGCKYAKSSCPIDECRCDCYVKQIFLLGREAQEQLFYADPTRAKVVGEQG